MTETDAAREWMDNLRERPEHSAHKATVYRALNALDRQPELEGEIRIMERRVTQLCKEYIAQIDALKERLAKVVDECAVYDGTPEIDAIRRIAEDA